MTDHPQNDTTLEDALAQTLARITPVATPQSTPISQCHGRILRQSITAPINVPQNNTAAVDGYAFRAGDNTTLPVVGAIKAGHAYDSTIAPGVAYRIFTGAAIPNGLDTVAMMEHCQHHNDGTITLPEGLSRGANFRRIGENVAKGETVLTAGTRLTPSDIGLLASLGISSVITAPRLTVAIISTGDEVAESGSVEGFVHDSNRPMLAQLLAADHHLALDKGIIADDLTALTHAYAEAAADADAVISSGGSSAGEGDYARAAITTAGGTVDFWRLAMKPGRPMAIGWLADTPIFCLPGNPVASFVCYRLLTMPCLTAMQGGRIAPPIKLPIASAFRHRQHPNRTEYLRARLGENPDDSTGSTAVFIHGRSGAGVLSSLTGADGLVEIRPGTGIIEIGDRVDFIPFRESAL